MSPFLKLATLGNGVTAHAVRHYINRHPQYQHSAIEGADLIITSPGIPPSQFPNTRTPIVSDIEFAYLETTNQPAPPTMIAVTGTNGKSTVCTWLGHVLNCPVVGNIGEPWISHIHANTPYIVIECSSYQLETTVSFRPDIAAILNISLDHLSRHPSLAAIQLEKAKITRNQSQANHLFYEKTDPLVCQIAAESNATTHPYHMDSLDLSPALIGRHNQQNATVVSRIASHLGLPTATIHHRLNTFSGLPYRIQHSRTLNTITFYNDSKATNTDATYRAILAMQTPPILILCGEDKGLPLDVFITQIHTLTKHIIVFGSLAPRFAHVFKSAPRHCQLDIARTMTDSVHRAYLLAAKNDVILFSPSSASFDQFSNFEARGAAFDKQVHQL